MGRLPTVADFPKKLKLNIVPPPKDAPPTNILVLLHGLGDNHESFTALGKQMNLPETACISLLGPQNLLDLGGFHWGDDIMFDSTSGGLDPDAGFKQSTEVLKSLIIQDVLVEKCGYKPREIMFFGFGQGGMAALDLAVALHQASPPLELGGIISIGAPLPSSAPSSLDPPKCKTPILICAGNDDSTVTSSAEEKLKHVFHYVEVKRYRKSGDSMPNSRDEMLPIMQFFSRRLRSVAGVPEGAVEVGS
ncbi:related to Phospholipase/Carboxylesterase superfamily [Ramularia collo-cygni]|uniref:Related to Phospholipase/Carboxylesterase superfamily n=1 Tax=Ramularia collo-cygni TaxID=112498 RepID=A0A2D3V3I4_9PEZI|nr:related to Phospholipase/Carboxylesterase superfamily [Ramularia collo-cygni]CZT21255.1 related to Phospholipase/Carboxylesterase superfamily [Ramularia collo-cygni]